MTALWLDWALRLCPLAEAGVARRLWREGRWRKLANYLWVEFLLARGAVRAWGGRPYWLTVDASGFCQLRCPFCPTGSNRGLRDRRLLPLRDFQALMGRSGPTAVHLDLMNWGEALLNPELPEMIAAAKGHGLSVKLDANFNDVTEGMVDGLLTSGLDVLSLSIDGLSQETYSRYRIGGRLDKVLANLERLVRRRSELGLRRPVIVWQFLVFRHNEHELGQVEEFARARGADRVSIIPANLPNEPAFLREWLPRDPRYQLYPPAAQEPSTEDLERVRRNSHMKDIPVAAAFHVRRFRPRQVFAPRYLGGLWRQAGGLRGLAAAWPRLRQAWLQGRGPGAAAPGPGRGSVCKWPWAGLTVNANGSVSPCCSVESQADDFGDAFAPSWNGLWNNTRYRAARRHVRRFVQGRGVVRPDSDHVCERCTAIGSANFRFPPDSGPAEDR